MELLKFLLVLLEPIDNRVEGISEIILLIDIRLLVVFNQLVDCTVKLHLLSSLRTFLRQSFWRLVGFLLYFLQMNNVPVGLLGFQHSAAGSHSSYADGTVITNHLGIILSPL